MTGVEWIVTAIAYAVDSFNILMPHGTAFKRRRLSWSALFLALCPAWSAAR